MSCVQAILGCGIAKAGTQGTKVIYALSRAMEVGFVVQGVAVELNSAPDSIHTAVGNISI